jgi:hypothetical protein
LGWGRGSKVPINPTIVVFEGSDLPRRRGDTLGSIPLGISPTDGCPAWEGVPMTYPGMKQRIRNGETLAGYVATIGLAPF